MSSPLITANMRQHLTARANEYHSQLRGSIGETYLKEERGFSDEAIDFFRLGYVETPMKGDQAHLGRIVIPYNTRSGVVALRSRSLPMENGGEEGAKYLPWMTGDVSRPFNTTALDTAEEVYITEGEFDTITAWMLGLFVVGIPGVSNWKSVYRPLFRYRRVTIIGDNDDSGQGDKFCSEVAKALGGCSTVLAPKGHDLNSFFVEAGKDQTLKHLMGDLDND